MKIEIALITTFCFFGKAVAADSPALMNYFAGEIDNHSDPQESALVQLQNRKNQQNKYWKVIEERITEATYWLQYKKAEMQSLGWAEQIIKEVSAKDFGSNARVKQTILTYPAVNTDDLSEGGFSVQTSSFFVEGSYRLASSSVSYSPNLLTGFSLNYLNEQGMAEIANPFLMQNYRQSRKIPHLERYLDMLAVQLNQELENLQKFARKRYRNDIKDSDPLLIFSTPFPLKMCKKMQKNAFGKENKICESVFPAELSSGLVGMLEYPQTGKIYFSPAQTQLIGTAVLNFEHDYKLGGSRMEGWIEQRLAQLEEKGVKIETVDFVGWPEYAAELHGHMLLEGEE